jgi:hypothetical protein
MVVKCKFCNKDFASYSSRSNHVKKYHDEQVSNKKDNEEKIKIKCDKCNFICISLEKLKEHNDTNCRPSVNSNNIYTFKANTLGKNKYKGMNGGDIYIIQTEFNLKGYYKIGISTNLYKRLQNYRCGSVLEPKLHYYYPCKNIRNADKILKEKLKKYNIKREIYKTDNLNEIRNIIKSIQEKMISEEIEIEPEIKECDILACELCELHFTNKLDLHIHLNESHKQYIQSKKDEFLFSPHLKMYKCKFCSNEYKHKQSKYNHEKKCNTSKNNNSDEIIEMKKQIEELKELVKFLK